MGYKAPFLCYTLLVNSWFLLLWLPQRSVHVGTSKTVLSYTFVTMPLGLAQFSYSHCFRIEYKTLFFFFAILNYLLLNAWWAPWVSQRSCPCRYPWCWCHTMLSQCFKVLDRFLSHTDSYIFILYQICHLLLNAWWGPWVSRGPCPCRYPRCGCHAALSWSFQCLHCFLGNTVCFILY